ncbi:MAG: ADP-ribosylglycohydrolase family protein [Streptosporangiales bacterium]|nr:ADP-ribosylglycohydrolase family protein [Streptosporangiales bacterium]
MEGAENPDYRGRVRGCLLGGAVGDALGAPIEFLSLDRIRADHGPAGVTGLEAMNGERGLVTDDTQMTLFTAEGLIRAGVREDCGVRPIPSVVHGAYLRWLDTQRYEGPSPEASGWLARQPWLYAQRAPGNACITGLRSEGVGTLDRPKNPNSKGCGAVMRSAPFGLVPSGDPFRLAVECAVQTHGHPSGYLAAGAFALIVRRLVDGDGLPDAVQRALRALAGWPGNGEVTAALRAAVSAAGPPSAERVESLGAGWVAEEALAIAVYCALTPHHPGGTREALLLAVNHSGDSDSTGAICGNLLGARYGEAALPPDWVGQIEGRDAILKLADDFAAEFAARLRGDAGPPGRWADRYPDP